MATDPSYNIRNSVVILQRPGHPNYAIVTKVRGRGVITQQWDHASWKTVCNHYEYEERFGNVWTAKFLRSEEF